MDFDLFLIKCSKDLEMKLYFCDANQRNIKTNCFGDVFYLKGFIPAPSHFDPCVCKVLKGGSLERKFGNKFFFEILKNLKPVLNLDKGVIISWEGIYLGGLGVMREFLHMAYCVTPEILVERNGFSNSLPDGTFLNSSFRPYWISDSIPEWVSFFERELPLEKIVVRYYV